MQGPLSLVKERREFESKLDALVIRKFEERTKGVLISNENEYRVLLKRLVNTSIYGQYKKEYFAGYGAFRILNCSIEEPLYFNGRKLEVMCSSIKEMQLKVEGKGQVIEIFDSHIKCLKIIGPRFHSLKKSLLNGCLYYNKDFILICRDVTIDKIESEESKLPS